MNPTRVLLVTLAALLTAGPPTTGEPFINGYPGKRSYVAGETATFHLSADVGRVDVEIARIGLERSVVWNREGVAVGEHPVPADATSHGCGWPEAFSVVVPPSWPSGCYEAWTRSADGKVTGNRMFFVVRPSHPGRDTKILLQLATNTYNAYNGWGGYSLYTYWGRWDVKHGPGDVLGRRVSFQRPFGGVDRRWELPFIQWAERNGYRLDYAINSDLEFHPGLLEHYNLVLSVGHDEYWSAPMRDNLEAFIGRGGNVAFFSGNVCCWQVRSEDGGNDLVCWKEAFEQDPLYRPGGHPLLSTLWSHHLVGRPENQMTGVGFLHGGFHRASNQIMDGSGGYQVHRPDHWVFEGTGLGEGDEFGGANTIVGYECDGAEFTLVDGKPVPTGRDGTPRDFIILATAPARWGEGDLGWYPRAHDLWKKNKHEHGTMGIYTKPGGGTVFTAATTDWSHGLGAGEGGGDASGQLGPGHAAGVFQGGTWNILNNHFSGKVVDENGVPLPHEVTVQFGAAGADGPISNWGELPQNYHLNTSAPAGAGNSALMNDMVWSPGPREQGGVRIRGLPAGTYDVFALLRHFATPEADRFAWAIGKNINQVRGHSFVARGGSRTGWVEARPDQAGNYARAAVSIGGPGDWITLIYDNLDRTFTEVMGFQIARVPGPGGAEPGFKIQFDAGGGGEHVDRITRNVLDRLSGTQPGPGAATGSVPRERPAIRPPSALHGLANWERAKTIFSKVEVPPAPPMTPAQEHATFRVAPGYRVELVAAEPMVANPIFFEFDADGRIWALEYRGYMRDLQGRGEADPICRMVVLEDTDADGRADKDTVYLDGLVMPRSFAFVEGGVLLAEPPDLWYCRDTDGDLRCDSREKVGRYGVAGNPQHTANGLRRGIDNWLHSADWGWRHRFRGGALEVEPAIHRGQFGVSFDDLGRFYSCRENIAAVMDYLPEEYVRRNPAVLDLYRRGGRRDRFGVARRIAQDAQEVFPVRPTPQITLGGTELRDDGTLRTYTIVAGTAVYRGDQFPPDARGNLFVPESGGHLVGRLVPGGGLTPLAQRFYPPKQELLASTDERFRPVNARTGPDGALYIADLYKGVMEHVIFMVPWLSDQIRERDLESGNDLGRIWRIVSTEKPIDYRSPALARAGAAELVENLGHPNGWRRDTAQRLLVDRRPEGAVAPLRRLARHGGSHLGRLHALWTLEGLGELDWETAGAALKDGHPHVRATALRVLERIVTPGRQDDLLQAIEALVVGAGESDPIVLQQALLTLGEAPAGGRTFALYDALLARRPDELGVTAALTGLGGKEEAYLGHVARLQGATTEAQRALIGDLANFIKGPLPGATALKIARTDVGSLTGEEKALVELGAEKYAMLCAGCHQPYGTGEEGVAPPLAGSEWVTGPPERFAQVVLRGLVGPIVVRDQEWSLYMPPLGQVDRITDRDLAAVLTFVRRSWGNAADPVAPSLIAREREASAGRQLPWTARELSGEATATPAEGGQPIQPDGRGQFLLAAAAAQLFAETLRYNPGLDCLGPWVKEGDAAMWQLEAPAAGLYRVHLTHAMDEANAGNAFAIESDVSVITGTVESTGGFDRYVEKRVGDLRLKAGTNRILVRPSGPPVGELIDLRTLRLEPAGEKTRDQ